MINSNLLKASAKWRMLFCFDNSVVSISLYLVLLTQNKKAPHIKIFFSQKSITLINKNRFICYNTLRYTKNAVYHKSTNWRGVYERNNISGSEFLRGF